MNRKRQARVEGEIAFIPLTQGYEAVIDAADLELIAGRNWCASVERRKDGSIMTVYAVSNSKFRNGERGPTIRLHRLIAGAPQGYEVDHRDADGLNNRRSNLRVASIAENRRNARKRITNISGVKGVYWNKELSKWVARIAVDGQQIYLGVYSSLIEAAAAYADASKKFHGEFGRVA